MKARDVSKALKALGSPEKARGAARFFKTGPGEYGEGDTFLGVSVPEQRKVARQFAQLPLTEVTKLLRSTLHEDRLTALIILVNQFTKAKRDPQTQADIYALYTSHLSHINNWDLVDSSAGPIVGGYLMNRDRSPLYRWVKSKILWERRVAMVCTQTFIKAGQHEDAFKLAEALLSDEHDLMHKATGWMLREVGKHISPELLRGFLKKHAHQLPRTALRYAIEHFDITERKRWLAAKG